MYAKFMINVPLGLTIHCNGPFNFFNLKQCQIVMPVIDTVGLLFERSVLFEKTTVTTY